MKNEKKINDILRAMKVKEQRIDELERRVNDLEQHSRKRNIIVTLTGLNVRSARSHPHQINERVDTD